MIQFIYTYKEWKEFLTFSLPSHHRFGCWLPSHRPPSVSISACMHDLSLASWSPAEWLQEQSRCRLCIACCQALANDQAYKAYTLHLRRNSWEPSMYLALDNMGLESRLFSPLSWLSCDLKECPCNISYCRCSWEEEHRSLYYIDLYQIMGWLTSLGAKLVSVSLWDQVGFDPNEQIIIAQLL